MREHICVSAARAPSCVGRLPTRLFSVRCLRAGGAPEGVSGWEVLGEIREADPWPWGVSSVAHLPALRAIAPSPSQNAAAEGAKRTEQCCCSCRRRPWAPQCKGRGLHRRGCWSRRQPDSQKPGSSMPQNRTSTVGSCCPSEKNQRCTYMGICLSLRRPYRLSSPAYWCTWSILTTR